MEQSAKKTAQFINETVIGAALIVLAIFLIWLLGYFLEPYLQWLKPVAELQSHAWYSTSVPASIGIGRSLFVGVAVLMQLFFLGLILLLAVWVVDQLHDLGQWVRKFSKRGNGKAD